MRAKHGRWSTSWGATEAVRDARRGGGDGILGGLRGDFRRRWRGEDRTRALYSAELAASSRGGNLGTLESDPSGQARRAANRRLPGTLCFVADPGFAVFFRDFGPCGRDSARTGDDEANQSPPLATDFRGSTITY